MSGTHWLFVAALAANGAQPTPKPLVVSVSADCRQPHVLQISVLNPSDRTIRVPDDAMPWIHSGDGFYLRVLALKDGKAQEFDRAVPIADYLSDTELAPKRVLRGTLDLDMALPDLSTALETSDVLVSFVVRPKHRRQRFEGQGGHYFLPRNRWFSSECPTLFPSRSFHRP